MRAFTYRRQRLPLVAASLVLLPIAIGAAQKTAPPVPGQGETAAAPASPPRVAVPSYRQANTVAVLTIHGPIDKVTRYSLERRVAEALAAGAEAVVLDIDTPGGALEATLDICHLVRTDAPANTVAWINPKAYSAGTIIALACRDIVLAPDATFGDAAPISPFGPIPVTERAKLESPILAEVVDSARRNHYDEKLVQSFVSVGVELWLIENLETGERVFVDKQEYETVFGEIPPDELTPVAPPQTPTAPPVRPWFAPMLPSAPGSGPALDAEEQQKIIELQQDRPSSRPQFTEADRGRWKALGQVISNDRLLVLNELEATYYGLSDAIIADDEQLKAYFGAQTVKRYDRAWSESLVQFLTGTVVRTVLLVIFVICLLIELAAPGLGVFGAAAGVSLLIVIGAPWLTGMAQWWEIMLIIVGIGLVGVELFIIPGFGVAGITGAGCVLVGLVGTFVSDDLSTSAGQAGLIQGLAATLTALLAAGIGGWLLFRQLETLPLLGRFILRTEVGEPTGPVVATGLLEAMGAAQHALGAGDVGVAETDLRPSGRASFEGRLADVQSVGDYIERGTRVRVVSVGRFSIEVEEAGS